MLEMVPVSEDHLDTGAGLPFARTLFLGLKFMESKSGSQSSDAWGTPRQIYSRCIGVDYALRTHSVHQLTLIASIHTSLCLRLSSDSVLVLLDERHASTGIMDFFPHLCLDLIDVRAGR